MKRHGHQWKGDKAGYAAVHSWLREHYSDCKTSCEECGRLDNLQFAKKHGRNYTRYIEDYRILCQLCHLKYDGNFIKGKVPWNKGNKAVYNKVCEFCKKSFEGKKKRSRFCSTKCSAKSRPIPVRKRDKINGQWLALNKK